MGLPDDAIEAYLAKDAQEAGSDDIEVLEENWDAVRVYRFCLWDVAPLTQMQQGTGFSRLIHVGIRSEEIRATADGLSVAYNEDLLTRVRILATEAAEVLNGS